ncbi:MAG: hypothetical protein H7Y59_16740 [Anaerolineales bacterium]|nr:hypothetical protein [Anaerolineales bacterium]
MSKSRRIFFSFVIISIVSSCNLPGGQVADDAALIATITAQAALLQSPSTTPTETQAITSTSIPTFTFTPETSQSISFTDTPIPGSTSGTPTVSVSLDTNCRKGPGQQYDVSGALLVGQTAEVVGKNSASNYWIIKTPSNSSATCWLWGQYATVRGDTSGLAEVAAPPTPTPTSTPKPTVTPKPTPPAAASNLSEQNTCTISNNPNYRDITATLTWADNSNNEKGFNIYAISIFAAGPQPDRLIGSVGPNSTSYVYKETVFRGTGALLKVEAFNDTGKSEKVAITLALNCP